MKKIDCFGENEITCPYCGYINSNYSDAMESLRGEGDKTDWECPKCGKEFTAILAEMESLFLALLSSTPYSVWLWEIPTFAIFIIILLNTKPVCHIHNLQSP